MKFKYFYECLHPETLASSPCSTMCVYNDYVVGGYGSGHIRVFNHQDGSLVAEITAHARWINALDVNPTGLVRYFNLYHFFSFLPAYV